MMLQEVTRPGGRLSGNQHAQREAGGFIVSDGTYGPGVKIGRHDHELASICVVLSGGYEERFGQRTRRCEPGVVIVHPAGEHHEEVHDLARTDLLTIEMDDALLQSLLPETRAFDDGWHRVDYSVVGMAQRLRFDISCGAESSDLAVESAALDMVSELGGLRAPIERKGKWLSDVQDALEAEFQRPPSMKALARLAGVHPVHLARAFRRRFGCTVGTYVRRLQVGKAIVLLNDHSISLSDAALESGFSDQSHMTRMVCAHTGLTPGAWRRWCEHSRNTAQNQRVK